MRILWRGILILLVGEWLFVDGLARGYAWFAREPFSLPNRVAGVTLVHVFLLLAALGVVLVFLLVLRRSPAWVIGSLPKPADWRALGLTLAFVFPVAFIGRLIVPDFDAWYADRSGFLVPALLGASLLSITLAVVKEELLERVLQRALLDAYSPLVVSLAVALQFGVAHYFSEPFRFGLASALSVIPVAFVLALLYAKTRSLIMSLAFHLIFNAVVVLQIILHAKMNTVGESLLWAAWGVAWLVTIRPAWGFFRNAVKGPRIHTKPVAWVFLGAFAFGLPLIYLFLLS
jgi:membrane protease YdiL (CAAX protease family)